LKENLTEPECDFQRSGSVFVACLGTGFALWARYA
jgi:hypothetical protein